MARLEELTVHAGRHHGAGLHLEVVNEDDNVGVRPNQFDLVSGGAVSGGDDEQCWRACL
jgi:hypothetical protein